MTATTKQDEDLIQYLIYQLNFGYEEFKKRNPEFRDFIEKEERKLKGNYGRKRTHCESCGSWLQGFDMCDECGRINT